MRSTTSKSRSRLKITVAGLLAAAALGLAAWQAVWLLPDLAGAGHEASVQVEDRRGRPLGEFLSGQDTRSRWTPLGEMSPYLAPAALAAEDKRFYSHPGVDPAAILRAAWLNLTSGRIVSGGSTITMQLVRILKPGPRTWKQKALEAVLALRMERSHSKEEILEEYLNRAPCGNLITGLPAAAEIYLDKSPANLTPAEAAFLMGLPQAPSRLNPYHGAAEALARRNWILGRMAELDLLPEAVRARAAKEPLHLADRYYVFNAPHLLARLKTDLPQPWPERVKTTIDLELQAQVQELTAQAVEQGKEKGLTQAAVLVLDHRTMEVLVWVGSADFFDDREGQNDGVTALRQPGSAVKPFTYATAFDTGQTPADMVDDSPVDYGLARGVYSPTNYDGTFHGEVSLRTALAGSLNVPAVKVLEKTGLSLVHEKMKAAGLVSLTKEADYYGLGLTLGAGEVSLLELATAYATLASGGLYRPPVYVMGQSKSKVSDGQPVFSPQAAYLVTDILSDDAARATGFGRDSVLSLPFPCAAKTGTSKNFRDNWTVGYTSSVVVAVWAGNFDSRPMGHVSGISGAGPLWRKVMRLVEAYYPAEEFKRPRGITEVQVCPESGLRATSYCPNRKTEIFIKGHEPEGYCLRHQPWQAEPEPAKGRPAGLAILSPRTGEIYLYDPGIETGFQNLSLKAQSTPDLDWLVWYINGKEVCRQPAQQKEEPEIFTPLKRGVLKIRLEGLADGRLASTDEVLITVY